MLIACSLVSLCYVFNFMISHLAQLSFSFSITAPSESYPILWLLIPEQEQRVRFQRRRNVVDVVEERSGLQGMSWTFRKLAK
jgi:hypothetical protein